MDEDFDISRIANLLADTARATILRVLIDGTMRPAGELAYAANISAQSASAHLAKLVDGGLLIAEAQGRHRYFRLANAQVADAIESLASLSVAVRPRAVRSPLPSKSTPVQFLPLISQRIAFLRNFFRATMPWPLRTRFTARPLGSDIFFRLFGKSSG